MQASRAHVMEQPWAMHSSIVFCQDELRYCSAIFVVIKLADGYIIGIMQYSLSAIIQTML